MKKLSWLTLQKKNLTFGCRKLDEIHGIGKTSAASILKSEESIRKEFEVLSKSRESVYFLKIWFIGTLLNELTFSWTFSVVN